MACCNSKNSNSSSLCNVGCCTNEKMCIETKRVFDACIQQRSVNTTLTVKYENETPCVITEVKTNGESKLSNLIVTPIQCSQNSRVQFTLTIPILVTGTTKVGDKVEGTSAISVENDIVLKVPKNGVIQPTIDAIGMVVGLQNSIASPTTIVTSACITIITKVLADVILIVPTCGYAVLPACQEYTKDVCSDVFNTPVFPR